MTTTRIDHRKIAELLEEAWVNRKPIEPLSAEFGIGEIADAYAIQTHWDEIRRDKGETLAGRKIGLTSRVVQEQMGVSEPDFGNLWESRRIEVRSGHGEADAGVFLQPRVEAEFAFLIGTPLPGDEIDQAVVLACTEAIAPALEIVDSRIVDWRITITDTIADNASYGGFALGEWRKDWLDINLAGLQVSLMHGGKEAASGSGEAALGHPANAVAWLANRLRSFGTELQPGDVVLSGAVAKMIPAAAGDEFAMHVGGEKLLKLRFG